MRASPTWDRQGVRTQAVGDHQLFPGCEAGMRAGLTCGGFTCAQEDSGGAAWSRTSCLEPQSLDTGCGWPWISEPGHVPVPIAPLSESGLYQRHLLSG